MKLIDMDEHWEIPLPTPEEFKPTDGNLVDILCGMEWVGQYLKSIPAVDPVLAAGACYCKECRHFEHREEEEGVSWTGYCKYGEHHTDEGDFCSRGSRREHEKEE